MSNAGSFPLYYKHYKPVPLFSIYIIYQNSLSSYSSFFHKYFHLLFTFAKQKQCFPNAVLCHPLNVATQQLHTFASCLSQTTFTSPFLSIYFKDASVPLISFYFFNPTFFYANLLNFHLFSSPICSLYQPLYSKISTKISQRPLVLSHLSFIYEDYPSHNYFSGLSYFVFYLTPVPGS